MKKLIKIIIVIIITTGLTNCSKKLPNPKYKKGDIVYLKPDSIKVLIIDDNVLWGEYEYQTTSTQFLRQYCNETDIY